MWNFGMFEKSRLQLCNDELWQETHVKTHSWHISVVKKISKVFQVTKFTQDMVKKPYWLFYQQSRQNSIFLFGHENNIFQNKVRHGQWFYMYRNQVRISSWLINYVEKESLQYVEFWHGKHCGIIRNQDYSSTRMNWWRKFISRWIHSTLV
jgi:hypothetical protein